MADLLVDTDVFVDHLRGARALEPGRHRISCSVIVRAELFAGAHADEAAIRLLLGPFAEIPVDASIAERAGRIRRETGVRLPDALVAATALEHGLALSTRNVRDYGRVRGLRIRDLPSGRARAPDGPD